MTLHYSRDTLTDTLEYMKEMRDMHLRNRACDLLDAEDKKGNPGKWKRKLYRLFNRIPKFEILLDRKDIKSVTPDFISAYEILRECQVVLGNEGCPYSSIREIAGTSFLVLTNHRSLSELEEHNQTHQTHQTHQRPKGK